MSTTSPMSIESLLSARVTLPAHVVYRAFAAETVMLNLQTGQYHGINATGGQMVEILERSASVRDAAAELERRFSVPRAELERDLCDFCTDLSVRGLIQITPLASSGR
jgi:hypothetical protein